MSDKKRLLRHLEEYIFAPEKEVYLGKLLPDTDEYTYLKLTNDLIKNGGELSEEMSEVYDRLIEKNTTLYDFKKGIKARKLLYDLGNTTDLAQNKELCKQLNKLGLNFRFTHKRPKIAEKMATDTGDTIKRESAFPVDPLAEKFELFTGDKGSVEDSSLQGIKSGYLLDRNLDDILKSIIDKNIHLFPDLLNRLPTFAPIKNLNKYILAYFKKESSPNFETIFKRLTVSELLALGSELKEVRELNTSFVNELYHKSFPEFPNVNQVRDIPILKKIYLYSLNPKISGLYPGLKRTILRVLLEALTKEGKPEAEFLEDFIKNPSQSDRVFSKKVIAQWVADYNSFNFVSEPSVPIAELVTNHLRLLHRSGFDVTKFDHYFNPNYIKKLRAEYQLKAGEKIDRVLETFSKTELDFLNDEKILSFVDKKGEFGPDDPVILKLDIKNNQKLTLKVFEINTGNYCRELLKNVEDNVKLDGLVSISEKHFTYTQPSIVSHEETFEIPELNNKKRGVFVIDFIGEGATSRAIIRKGYLSLLTKKTRTGYNCKILDEQFGVCKGEHTGVYLEGKLYKAEADGTIRMEYPSYATTHNLVLEHEGFFYVVSEKLEAESITVVANWIYSEETFLPGNKCNLALNVAMFVSGCRVPVSTNIKETKIETEFIKANNIKSSTKVEGVVLKDNEDYLHSFYLPNGTKQINLKVTFSYPTLKGLMNNTEQTHSITLLDRENAFTKTHIYLRKVGQDYYLFHLGKNGEPITNTELTIGVKYIWRRDKESHVLISDDKGKIKLGPLLGATMVGVTPVESTEESLGTWFNLWDEVSAITTEVLFKTEGESFRIPRLPQFEEKGIEFSLQKVNNKMRTVLEDCSKNVTKKDGFFVVDGLTAGDYVFRYTKSSKKVNIAVLQGKYLSEETIQSKKAVFRVPEKNYVISNIVGENVDADGKTLELRLDNHGPNTRLHIISETFLEEGTNRLEQINRLNANNNLLSEERVSRILQPKLSYLEDRQLPGEMVYAMNRRNNDPAIGTTSEKPALFIKRQDVRDTNYISEENVIGDYDYPNQEDEAESMEYMEEVAEMEDDYDDYGGGRGYGRKEQKRGKGGYGKKKKGRVAGGSNFLESTDDYSNNSEYGSNSACQSNVFEKSRHFLKTGSVAQWNLHPDAQGKVRVNIEAFPTKTLRVLVVNDCFSTAKTINVDNTEQTLSSDLRLQVASDTKKMFAYERDVYKVLSGVKTAVPGFTSCQYELIDSFSKLLSVKAEISGDQLGERWSFFKNWNSLKIGQKVKVVDEMFSYELGVFLFKKDKEFFEVTIKDFIKCRVKKTVIDHYLLEDTEVLVSYITSASKASQLNVLEKILLIDALSVSHPVQCQSLLQSLQGQDALNSYEGSLSFPSLFDRLINSGDQRGEKVKLTQVGNNRQAYGGEFDDEGTESEGCSDESSQNSCGGARMKPSKTCAVQQRISKPYNRNQDRKEEKECMEDFDNNNMFGDEECESYPVQEQCYEEQICIEAPRLRANRDRARRRGGSGSEENDEPSDEDEDHDDGGHFNLMDIKKIKREPTVTRLIQTGLKTTKEYREMGYYFQNGDQETYFIQSNSFWVDLAKHLLSPKKNEPFLSENFLYVDGQQLPFALAFLNFNQTAPLQKFTSEGGETYLTLEGGNGLLFLKHLKERDQVEDTSNTVLAAQKWFERIDRFEYNPETGVNEEKVVSYFLKGKVYGCQVVVTNVSSVEQKIQVITEIPKGAIPIYQNDIHQSLDYKLSAFSTRTNEFYFYFPESGKYTYCPACVTREGKKVTVQASSTDLNVLDEPPKKNELKSIKDILAQGSKEDILAFMTRENITNQKIFLFDEIYWLLRDEQFYRGCLQILKDKLIFDEVVWSYALYHGDVGTFFDYLQSQSSKPSSTAASTLTFLYFNNTISSKPQSPLKLSFFRFLEYHPIVNPRFHQLSKEKSSILNQQFFETYLNFLQFYFERGPEITAEERLILTYYLLLQDRIDEAYGVYGTIPAEDATKLGFSLQYDYMGAYFDLYKGMPTFSKAKAICEKYFDYPIINWRSLFIEIANQLAELEGETAEKKTDKKVEDTQGDSEVLKGTMVESNVEADYANIAGIKVELFEVDLEVLFSLYPFRTNEFDQLIFSQPHHVMNVGTEKSQVMRHIAIPLPEAFAKKNLLVKLTSSTNTCKSVIAYSFNRLNVTVSQDTGRLKVSDKQSGQFLSRVYVKVFIQNNSGDYRGQFFRDGYTDVVGGFNYFDSSCGTSGIKKFAVFVEDKKMGSLMLSIDPPKNGQVIQTKVALVSKKMQVKQKEMMNKRYNAYSKGAYKCEEED